MSWLSKVLRRARGSEPEREPELEEQVRLLLDEYAARLREREDSPPKVWIFSAGVDHEAFERAFLQLFSEARQRGRADLARELAEEAEPADECSCRCRAHGRLACPACLAVERCQVHEQEDPRTVSPAARGE